MFNKEKSKEFVSCKINKNLSLKKIGTFMVSISLLLSVNALGESDIVDDCTILKELAKYDKIVENNRKSKEYSNKLMDIMYFGKYEIDGKKYNLDSVFIAYTYVDGKLVWYLLCPSLGNVDLITKEKHNTKVSYINLSFTTLFIELLENNLLIVDNNNILHFDMTRKEEIVKLVNNWDGKAHTLTPEMDVFDNEEDLVLLKVKKNESK